MPWWIIPALLLVLLAVQSVRSSRRERGRMPLTATRRHYGELYSRRRFLRLGAAVAASALLAYSGADTAIDEWQRAEVKNDRGDRLSSFLHAFGERFWFGYWALFAAVDSFLTSTPLSRWGRANFESMLSGLPMLWGTQRILGAARPRDETHGPRFLPFADDNSASGHAFISSVPLWNAIDRLPSRTGRAALYALLPWVGWSRMNDGKHYLGQVLLGWWIARESSQAVRDPEQTP